MSQHIKNDIFIIGSGPAGLATALGLSRLKAGITCFGPKIIPANENPDTRTIALFQGSIEFLKNLGIWDECIEHSTKLRTIRILDNTKRLIRSPETTFNASELGLEVFGYNIPNAILIEKLYQAFIKTNPDAYVETSAVTELKYTDKEVIAQTSEGKTYSATLAIGADGKKSLSREAAHIKTTSWRYPQTALVCNFAHSLPHEEISNEFHCEAGPTTTVPLEGSNSSLVLVETPSKISRMNALDDKAFASELEKRMHGLLGDITSIGKRAQFPLSGLTARTFAQNRIALIGEAAHVIPPIGAQGLNLGLRDAAALIETLDQQSIENGDYGSPEILAAYNKARNTDIWSRTFAVDILNRSLLSGFLPVQAFRSITFGLINKVGPLRRFLMKQGMQPDFALPSLMKPHSNR